MIWPVVAGAAGAAAAAWGWYEAGWVRLETEHVALRRLPKELDGLRIAHLSDFHLGMPSRGTRAVERAVEWVESRQPDLSLVSGDLLAHPRGERRLRTLLARLPNVYAVLGNHDYAVTKDPFSRPIELESLEPARLLFDEAETLSLRGRLVQIVGVDPRSYWAGTAKPERLADESADLRILLCHFPNVIDRLPPGVFDLVLAGHLHAGQVTLPYPGGRVRLSHLRWTYVEGLYDRPAGMLHLSAGLGTTFVPFRFFARPAVYELVLHSKP
ncbi:MAG: metallophosphoesterase [Actinobacteria bacterium]|nr:metallophosphoesterase [Actinomycetota bacterium]